MMKNEEYYRRKIIELTQQIKGLPILRRIYLILVEITGADE